MLFDKDRHVALKNIPWSENNIRETIRSIYKDTLSEFNPEKLWSAHPDEEGNCSVNKSLYLGATGTLLGLNVIAQKMNFDLKFDTKLLIDQILEKYRAEPDTEENVPS